MRRLALAFLYASIGHSHVSQLASSRGTHRHDESDPVYGGDVERTPEDVVDTLIIRALLQPQRLAHREGLESTALGKPGLLATSPRGNSMMGRAAQHSQQSQRSHRSTAMPAHRVVQSMTDAALPETSVPEKSISALKFKLLGMAASLDRGQAYNPTSGEHYADRAEVTRTMINTMVEQSPALPTNLSAIDGEWELIFSTVRHGIFRSSPFFLAIQEALGDRETADLAFRLHELQTHQWGLSKVGRVAQYINSTEGRLYSEFDTSLLSMTAIPLFGFWKLLPTFGGCVVTASDVELVGDQLLMEVQYTEGRPVPGLPGLPFLPPGTPSPFQNQRVPVNDIWQRLPWNGGKKPTCSVQLKYVDEDMRIVADGDGDFFVYTRPVDPRSVCSL